jgi:hypothetical protein
MKMTILYFLKTKFATLSLAAQTNDFLFFIFNFLPTRRFPSHQP